MASGQPLFNFSKMHDLFIAEQKISITHLQDLNPAFIQLYSHIYIIIFFISSSER
jgi:hypothetical protein